MFNSLKLKFIISFLVVEMIFFIIIASINFNSINKASQDLSNEKLKVTSQLLSDLIKTPLIVHDLATIDDILKNFSKVENVLAIQIDNKNNNIVSNFFKDESLKPIIEAEHKKGVFDQENDYTQKYLVHNIEIVVHENVIGHIHFIIDNSQNITSIETNKNLTIIMIFTALLIGYFIASFIANNLSRSLSTLTEIAKDIAHDKMVDFTYEDTSKDEIGTLFYNMHIMQKLIRERTQKLNSSINDLKQFQHALDETAIVSKTDIQGNITYVNEKFCQISGYTRSELIGKNHRILRDPDEKAEFYKDMWSTILSKNVFHATFKNIKKNKKSYYVDATILPLLDNNKEILEFISIRYEVTDIVDAKNKAIEAKKSKRELLIKYES